MAGFELADVFAVAVEVLDAAIFGVGDPEVAGAVEGDAGGCLNWPLPEPSVPKAVE